MIFGGLEFVVGAKLVGASFSPLTAPMPWLRRGRPWRSIRFRRPRIWPSTTASLTP